MKKLILIGLCLVLGACTPKKTTVQANTNANATISGVNAGQCGSFSTTSGSNIGTIYDQSQSYSSNFENQVKGLLSATVSPYEVGTISSRGNDTTGVRFTGKIKLDASGNVVGAQSKIVISVYDSIWLMKKYTNPNEVEIQLEFDPAKKATLSGNFNPQSGEGYLSVKDQYGEIRFEGKIDAQNFSGVVKYQNTVSVLGSTPSAGILGQFFITRCGIVQ